MNVQNRIRLRRVGQFVVATAVDLLVPDGYDKLLGLYRNFHKHFLVTDLPTRIALYRELDDLPSGAEDEVIDLILEKLTAQMPPGCALPENARQAVAQMVQALRAAKDAEAGRKDPAEAMRRSLNANLLTGKKVEAVKLDANQKSLGQLLFASRMEAMEKPPIELSMAGGPVLPDYTFLKPLGSGGFGTVVLAFHKPTGTHRAVKYGPLTDPARFRREIELSKRLDSPHVVKYFESGEQAGQYWIAMEYLGETTLADLMKLPTFRERLFLLPQIGEQLLAGLAALHTAGIIHRDLKPANVMVDEEFHLKLIDIGLAKPVEKLHGYSSTTAGMLIGSAFYMSPEQLKAKADLTPASDIYSAGALMYELFVGVPPHQAESFAEVVLKAFTEPIVIEIADIPSELRPFLSQCLKREAGERFPNGVAALDGYRSPAQVASRRLRQEHFKRSWAAILERKLLETFAAEHFGVLPENAIEQFQQVVQNHGLPACDSERLAEILSPIFAAEHTVQMTVETMTEAKQRFAGDAVTLSAEQMGQRAQEIKKLEEAVSVARQRVTTEVRKQLAEEVADYDKVQEAKRKAEAEAETQREAESRRLAQAEADRRKEQERQLQRDRQAREARQATLKRNMATAGRTSLVSLVALGLLGGFYLFCVWVFVSKYGEERVLTGHTSSVKSVAFSPDGGRIAFGSDDKTVRVWDAASGKELVKLTGHTSSVKSVAFGPDGGRIASGSDDKTVRVWDAASGKELAKMDVGGTVKSVAFSPDGGRIASGSDDTVRVWDAASGKELAKMDAGGNVNSVAFSPDGGRLASGSWYNTVRVWDAASGKELAKIYAGGTVNSVAFSSDGCRIASGSDDTVRVWDAASGKELVKLTGHTSSVKSVAFSPDGGRIASGSDDDTVCVWDAASGKELAKLTGHTSSVNSVAFSPDGGRIASGSDDKTVRIWKRQK